MRRRTCAAPAPTRTGTAYDYGHLRYDLAVDAELAHAWADAIDAAGLQARRTRYDGLPVDTGTVTAAALLDPVRRRWAIGPCNLYADPDVLATVAAAGVRAAGDRRVAVVAVSGLSSGLIPRWITPAEDRIAEPSTTGGTGRSSTRLAAGDDVAPLRAEFARAAQADSQFRAHAFLTGTGAAGGPGEVLAYGPVWGTGAAVVWWPAERGDVMARAVGFIEAEGFVPIFDAVDAMVKATEVEVRGVDPARRRHRRRRRGRRPGHRRGGRRDRRGGGAGDLRAGGQVDRVRQPVRPGRRAGRRPGAGGS